MPLRTGFGALGFAGMYATGGAGVFVAVSYNGDAAYSTDVAGCSGWFVWCHGRGVVCVGAVA